MQSAFKLYFLIRDLKTEIFRKSRPRGSYKFETSGFTKHCYILFCFVSGKNFIFGLFCLCLEIWHRVWLLHVQLGKVQMHNTPLKSKFHFQGLWYSRKVLFKHNVPDEVTLYLKRKSSQPFEVWGKLENTYLRSAGVHSTYLCCKLILQTVC